MSSKSSSLEQAMMKLFIKENNKSDGYEEYGTAGGVGGKGKEIL